MLSPSLVIISFALTASVLTAKETGEPLMETSKAEAKTFYDQRQTGKYNVHVNIKDVQFFSLSDSLGSIGGDYGDYGDYGSYDTDSDYDSSHLTVNPIFALLGSKPTAKPTSTTTQKSTAASASPEGSVSTEADKGESTTTTTTIKQELETTVKQQSEEATSTIKPALKPLKVDDNIEYDEIPVEVQYYRANHPKLPISLLRQQHHNKRYRRPASVQILDGRNNNNNVKIIESDQLQPATIKICGRGEFRDSHGRCRLKAHGRNRVPGL
jgi:hypothetical protein